MAHDLHFSWVITGAAFLREVYFLRILVNTLVKMYVMMGSLCVQGSSFVTPDGVCWVGHNITTLSVLSSSA